MARPTKLTPELQESLCKMIKGGVHPDTACQIEGLHVTTWYDWRKRGHTGEEPYASFLEHTERALGEANKEIEGNIVKAAKTDWRAGAFLLSKRMRDSYGDKTSVEVTGPKGGPLQLTPEAADVIRRKVLYGEDEGEG